MKVIIDLIEDIASGINSEQSFSLRVMGLEEDDKAQFLPVWQSDVCQYTIDPQAKKLFLFLGKEEAVQVGGFLEALNALENEAMLYELCVSYTKENQRIDSPLLGFGESLKDKKYLLFIEA